MVATDIKGTGERKKWYLVEGMTDLPAQEKEQTRPLSVPYQGLRPVRCDTLCMPSTDLVGA